ncbi:hypothetical protein Noda2021_00660 [Candidatus Dependentiae bacterium Noda2021]|nr:hypothetical protein Noda2021_00660 [Candidatus Dependentiae bacterium Noda2021]
MTQKVLFLVCLISATTYGGQSTIAQYINRVGQPALEYTIDNKVELNLASRGITSLEGFEMVTGKQDVNIVLLDHNEIAELPVEPSILKQFDAIEELWMTNNKLTEVYAQAFASHSRLVWLSLNHNQINKIYSQSFACLTNLVDLNLAGNKIKQLPRDAFEHLGHLRFLDLGENQLDHVPVLTGLTQLRVLLLNHNHITRVKGNDLQEATRLEKVDFESNPLKRIDAGFFDKKHLRVVHIGNVAVSIIATAQQLQKIGSCLQE